MRCTIIAANIERAHAEVAPLLPSGATASQKLSNALVFTSPELAEWDVAGLQARASASQTTDAPFDVFFYARQPKLVVFDMDSTLIKNECIDLIARRANVEPQVAAITERAMQGELDFAQSLAERVGLLRGVKGTVYAELTAEIELSPGAAVLARGLRMHGVKTAVLSGGFQPIVDWIKGELDLDYAYANHLVLDERTNELTGATSGPIVDGNRKAELLAQLAAQNGIDLADVVAVGDGSNDLPMMARAGYGVAWHAKPIVRARAPSQLNSASLADLLVVFGLN